MASRIQHREIGSVKFPSDPRKVAGWGDPIVVRSQFYPIDECDIYVAGDLEGLAAVSGRDRPVAELDVQTCATKRRTPGWPRPFSLRCCPGKAPGNRPLSRRLPHSVLSTAISAPAHFMG